MDPKIFTELQKLPGNKYCVDCNAKEPDWGIPNFGILVCIHCSGKHRGLGVHISFVRSIRMDDWTEKQIQLMKLGGNQRCNEFLVANGLAESKIVIPSLSTTSATVNTSSSSGVPPPSTAGKYDTPQAELYKQVLLAQYEGKPIPTELPPRPPPKIPSYQSTTSSTTSGGTGQPPRRVMEGFGSSPIVQPSHESSLLSSITENKTATTAVCAVACVATAAILWMLVPH